MDAGEDVRKAPAAGRPAPLLEVLPQEQAQRSTVEQIVDPVLEVPMLQMVAPQMVEQLVDILTPKIVCPPRAARTVLGAPQTVALFFLRQGSPGDLHRAPRRGSAGSRREVRGSLEESLVRDTRRTATLAEGTGRHADLGFKHSRLQPGFYHQGRDIALVSHVDDLLIGGTSEDLIGARKSIEKKYDIKGTDIENAKDGLKFLGRRIERQEDGYVWSADPKHSEILLDERGLVNANPVSTPVATENDQDWVAQEMPKDDATKFRRAVARLNYLALDRPDLCVAAAKLSRCMARPRGRRKVFEKSAPLLAG